MGAGKKFGFFAPALVPLNWWPTVERPWQASGRAADLAATARLLDATQASPQKSLGKLNSTTLVQAMSIS
jgi:hypothetical protein